MLLFERDLRAIGIAVTNSIDCGVEASRNLSIKATFPIRTEKDTLNGRLDSNVNYLKDIDTEATIKLLNKVRYLDENII